MAAKLALGGVSGLIGGMVVVSSAAAAVERATPPPTYSKKAPRFDLSSFNGRFASMLSQMDPSTLFYSDEDIKKAVDLLNRFEAEGPSVASNEELWQARKLKTSAIHPDTKEIVARPFRMAGYVPFNGPICVSMMVFTQTPQLVFFNWLNQTHNAAVNYANRNASSESSNEVLAQSYAMAVSTALAVALGSSMLIKRSFDPATAQKMLKFVALPAATLASSGNAYMMRSPEIEQGVALLDSDEEEIIPGVRSSAAASKAVWETVYSRMLLQLPTFFLPPVFMLLPPVASLAAASPVFNITANTFVTLSGFGLGLPAAVAFFPQIGELKIEDIENEEVKKEAIRRGLTHVYYNKGL